MFKRIVENIVNVLLIATCSLSLYIMVPTVWRHIFPPPAPTATPRVEDVTGYDFSKHSATLVLAVRDGCRFCEANVPFYQKLHPNRRVDILYAIPGDPENAKKYLEQKKLDGKALSTKQLGLKVIGTPTIWLVDSRGKVIRLWFGEVNEQKQGEILTILEKGV